MSEATFSRKVQKWLRNQGAWVTKFHASNYTAKGVPDLLVCYRGRFIGIELKTNSSLSDWQHYQGRRIMAAGGVWLALHPNEFPRRLIKELNRINHGRRS